ncbi:hypothetical protein IEQ34_002082 [Dendrobium chrysotoxum]|uniref:Uncharacterized protein n=1 Tax=Dendrobium chrysotoxum TaxID=161865 RepID=A0AAV7HL42_DENCH|nr:hypothetical protein IEQ34_002082 [Dendrobium chrysotoxum]
MEADSLLAQAMEQFQRAQSEIQTLDEITRRLDRSAEEPLAEEPLAGWTWTPAEEPLHCESQPPSSPVIKIGGTAPPS